MRKRRRRSRQLANLGEPANVVTVYVSTVVNRPDGSFARNLSRKEKAAVVNVATRLFGGYTKLVGEGRYEVEGKRYRRESSLVFETVKAGTSCREFRTKAHRIAGELARLAHQDSVLVDVRCARGGADADFVGQNGKRRMSLYPL